MLRQRRISVDHTWVEAYAENGGNVLLLAFLEVFPLVVAVPGRGFADFARFFVNGGVQIGHAGIDAGTQHRHVEERGTDVDDDLRFGFADQRLGRFDVQSVQRKSLDFSGLLEAALGLDAVDDGLAFGDVARRDSNTTEFVVVLRALVGHHLGDTSCTNDKNVLLQFIYLSFTASLRQAGQVVFETKLANHLDSTVELFHYDGRHFQAVEPVFLDHGVTRCVNKRQPIADGQRTIK
ncbi:hypothetical protein D3C72_1583340 [compost metagenome]